MKTIFAFAILIFGTSIYASQVRCGWIENPTPANYWLTDSAGDWIISTQGGHQAEGDVAYPVDYSKDYVATNGGHGYWCGCIRATTDVASHQVLKITHAVAAPLKQCLEDKALPQDYRPRSLVHSSGKAYTECVDENEIQAGFLGHQVCINKKGEYYFLAE